MDSVQHLCLLRLLCILLYTLMSTSRSNLIASWLSYWLLWSFMPCRHLYRSLPQIPCIMYRLWADTRGKIQPHSQKSSTSLKWKRGHQHLLPLWVRRLSYPIQISGSWQSLSRKISTSGEYQSGLYNALFQEKRLQRAIPGMSGLGLPGWEQTRE